VEYLREHHLLLKKSIKRKKGGLRTQDEFEFIHEHAKELSLSRLI
jgi:hypothetical protein